MDFQRKGELHMVIKRDRRLNALKIRMHNVKTKQKIQRPRWHT